MATIRVLHTLGDLERDLTQAPIKAMKGAALAVKKNTRQGNALARGNARGSSGRHGKNYYKRITHEMRGPLEGIYGPTGEVKNNAVGGGWRNGPPNTDLARSADIAGPKLAKDIGDILDGLFW